MPYGRSAVLLFSGPPGVGKTACAEAIASELSRPLLVADYSQIENCYVGGTEKNIVRIFREAQASQAVLFWDEADAMLYSRSSADRSWEVRHVNVLLQELERFEGVCILATNREASLDPALARRVPVKVQFTRPDRSMRLAIWRKLVPEALPLASDIDLESLSFWELTGGEIKNVILNAARLALQGRQGDCVTMAHFDEALAMETQTARGTSSRIGFRGAPREESLR
jgi:SpoVK/Ycf46/Vps4 family AAA+-type ATPase